MLFILGAQSCREGSWNDVGSWNVYDVGNGSVKYGNGSVGFESVLYWISSGIASV